uniref:Choline/carnitine acyltransferase domain-containing protein n=1 Tax=Xiphophorus couchianus TaxID=32473 RepID=A0A3B5MP45_9TELE
MLFLLTFSPRRVTKRETRFPVSFVQVSPRQEPCFYSTVPPQPVPPLTQTLQGYLRALEPLLPPEELNHTRRMVQEFGRPGGLGQQLQEGLERRARLTKNWVSDLWVQWAYLESRQPLAVHSNPAISLPRRDYNDWRSQLLLTHNEQLELPVEYMRGKPLCMELYPLLFSSSRIPGPKHDYVARYSNSRRSPTHITVVRNYQVGRAGAWLFLCANAAVCLPPVTFSCRVHSEVCPACDIASQRMFRGGRTEYIRSPTNQALKFILAFDDRTVREAKLELLREAVDAYSELTAQALRGHGIDRHLLGLKLQAIEEGLSIPKIFMDTAYGLATHWKLRTGQVPTNTDSVMCFGPLVPDGYAVCYNPQADHVHFAVTAFNCCEETNAETMARTLKETLCDLQELLQPTV